MHLCRGLPHLKAKPENTAFPDRLSGLDRTNEKRLPKEALSNDIDVDNA
jgi:hypothetical protein